MDSAHANKVLLRGRGLQDVSEHPAAVFHSIRGHRAYESVVAQITFAIRTGTYAPGDWLPSIEELSQRMGISKPVVGEAIKALSTAGVVAAVRGSRGGLRVLSNNIPPKVMRLSAHDIGGDLQSLLEARRATELHLAVFCGQRATNEEFERMEEAIELFRKHMSSGRVERLHADHLFHYSMGRFARSELLADYQHQILEQLVIVLADYFNYQEDPHEVARLHEDTLRAIRTRDEATILAAVDRHLDSLETAVQQEMTIKQSEIT